MKKIIERQLLESDLTKSANEYSPTLRNISSAFIFQYVLVPDEAKNPEYVYIPEEYYSKEQTIELDGFISQWNMTWEMGQIRNLFHEQDIPKNLSWLKRFREENIYLIPELKKNRFYAYSPLYHLLPARILIAFGLPLLRSGIWPYSQRNWTIERNLPMDFDLRLAKAFAYYVWPLLNSRTKMEYFSEDEPIKVLAHNLDFWLPYVNMVIEERLKQFPRAEIENAKQAKMLKKAENNVPEAISVYRPLIGGQIWEGEEEAWDVLIEVVERADSQGMLRALIDAVKSNRVQDDFSNKWSYEREDFERKLYKKRSKYRVKFVELSDTIPVIGPYSEVDERMFWQDFMTILDHKEKQVVVMLRNGTTNLSEIGKELGYANHSPISKALRKIQKKLQDLEE
ncbi:hypothetical protein B4V02_23990 [Paenibacillus kribbensis]|uniref:Uncharacterized protein n=1 Tax=Paenibacillus kribbensis TaxID=172713 RepID=A0A222WU47_9BACL|nr:hypothetical protein [Paenibacillus kribbensis]ASR49528.1 hypothetical protein B4V02_23990 [Paenibacillus kribbensis]